MAREKLDYRANLARIKDFCDGDVLTVQEVARFLKVGRHTATRLIETRRIVGVNISAGKKNASWRVSAESLARFIS